MFTNVRFLVVLFLAAVVATSTAVAQVAPQTFNRPTADELYNRAGVKSAHRVTLAEAVRLREQARATPLSIAVLRSSGSIVSTPTASIVLDVKADFGRPVWIAGRVFMTDDQGRLSQYGRAFYSNKSLALTRSGPGYFPSLVEGAVLPFAEVPTGNAGDQTVVEVTLFDSQNGGAILQTLSTSFWNREKPVSASVVPGCIPTSAYSSMTGEPCSPVAIASASILGDGVSMVINGSFPIGQLVVAEIGDPEWDAGFIAATSADGKTLRVSVPTGKSGNFLYPRMWAAQSNWTVVVATSDGTSVTAPNLLRVEGNSSDLTVRQSVQ